MRSETIIIATSATEGGVYEFTETAVNKSAPEFQQSAKVQINISLDIPDTPINFKARKGECGSKSIKLGME
ncbi:MAG: Fibronectin type-III protein [Candidatus Brocadiaceae bacterium]|nr:Fibronectin type-III protein [Candidatus Brocadiaceae bacterium]